MKQAGAAMAQIHGGMSIDKVDETMYVGVLTDVHTTIFINVYVYALDGIC